MRLAMLCLTLVLGCRGGGEGGDDDVPDMSTIDQSQPVGDIDLDEAEALCDYLVAISPPTHTVTCPEGDTFTVDQLTTSGCLSNVGQDLNTFSPDCAATAGQYEDCMADQITATDAELCDGALPVSCGPLVPCV